MFTYKSLVEVYSYLSIVIVVSLHACSRVAREPSYPLLRRVPSDLNVVVQGSFSCMAFQQRRLSLPISLARGTIVGLGEAQHRLTGLVPVVNLLGPVLPDCCGPHLLPAEWISAGGDRAYIYLFCTTASVWVLISHSYIVYAQVLNVRGSTKKYAYRI